MLNKCWNDIIVNVLKDLLYENIRKNNAYSLKETIGK